ncbi:NnrS family protein [Paraglaciecola aquimarina]|uniref:NnrS family protein n=1 Tax=Paraglaciecola aquimarina TaxID=1235557 RepID=A0ABU3T113_9ALTE|nr:NnrS family protein [Paraglaciecola aquimarina]MDU0355898.1 NnrS family protein [Paraglaciecola aquimarina]
MNKIFLQFGASLQTIIFGWGYFCDLQYESLGVISTWQCADIALWRYALLACPRNAFGFVAAIIAGFLLTAVQNWTGLRATHGKSLMLLVVVWFTGRLLMLSNLTSLQWLTALVDMSFLLLCAILMAKLVINVNQYRNLIFVPLLLLIMTGNALTHLSVVLQTPEYYRWGMYSTVMTITLLISIIAGRILPMFTANGTNTKRVHNLAWLETLTLGSTLTLTILQLANLPSDLPQGVAAGIFALAALAHSIRGAAMAPSGNILHPFSMVVTRSLLVYTCQFYSIYTALFGNKYIILNGFTWVNRRRH